MILVVECVYIGFPHFLTIFVSLNLIKIDHHLTWGFTVDVILNNTICHSISILTD